MNLLSLVVPCYNEQEMVPLFYKKICETAEKFTETMHTEVIFVDDGSTDSTLKIIKRLDEKNVTVRYLSFSRNFGKEAAMFAGLEKAKGEYIAIMDVDLQDPPELLIPMLKGIDEEGYDCVATRRVTRKGEPPIRSFFARAFYRLINKMSRIQIVDGARDFRLMTRKMADAVLRVKEYNRFSKGIFSWVGFKTKWLEYENAPRAAGETKWSFWRLVLYSLDGIVAFSTVPLAIASVMGLIFCLLAAAWIVVIIVKTFVFGDPVAGYPSLICVILFIGGIQLFCIGILGQYLAKTYLETKRRPLYILKEETD